MRAIVVAKENLPREEPQVLICRVAGKLTHPFPRLLDFAREKCEHFSLQVKTNSVHEQHSY
jgi:hypothetical protein